MTTFGGGTADFYYLVDTFVGNGDSDIFYVDNYLDKVIENKNEGTDKVVITADYAPNKALIYNLPANIEELDVSNFDIESSLDFALSLISGYTDAQKNILKQIALEYLKQNRIIFNGNNLDNTFTTSTTPAPYVKLMGLGGNDTFNGSSGDDYFDGGTGNDILIGGAGNDTLIGGAGNDYLEDASGTNILNGGAGNDTYVFNGADSTTIIDASGIDTIITDTDLSLEDYKTIEAINASGSENSGLNLTGNALNNTIYASSGINNILTGGLGNDVYVSYDSNLTIIEAGPNVKNSGNDTLKITGDSIVKIQLFTDNLKNIENIDATGAIAQLWLEGSNVLNTIL